MMKFISNNWKPFWFALFFFVFFFCGSLFAQNNFYLQDSSYSTEKPVELIAFNVFHVIDNIVKIEFITATETENHGFEIQRRNVTLEEDWLCVEFIRGHGTVWSKNIYEIYDTSIAPGNFVWEYRLKQIDFNGAFNLYPPVDAKVFSFFTINLSAQAAPLNNALNVSFSPGSFSGRAKIEIFSATGRKVHSLTREINSAGESEFFEFDFTNRSSGVYVVVFSTNYFVLAESVLLIK